MVVVVHGRRRQVHITQTDDSHTNPPDNVGVVPSEQGGGTSSQVRTREQKSREIETVLDYMLSKCSISQYLSVIKKTGLCIW